MDATFSQTDSIKLQPHIQESTALEIDNSTGSPIPLSVFPAHVDKMHANENHGFCEGHQVSAFK